MTLIFQEHLNRLLALFKEFDENYVKEYNATLKGRFAFLPFSSLVVHMPELMTINVQQVRLHHQMEGRKTKMKSKNFQNHHQVPRLI